VPAGYPGKPFEAVPAGDCNQIREYLSQTFMKIKKTWIRTELPQLLLLVAGVLAARSSLADHYYVPSGSMEYTLMSGDRVLVDKMANGVRLPFTGVELTRGDPVGRGEVVIFDSPRNGDRLIKRIVGVGGDVITISNGNLFVNGVSFADDDVELFGERKAYLNLVDGGGPDVVRRPIPDGMLLAVGDHRDNSLDGRDFGLIAEQAVYGKALGVYRRRGEGFVWIPL
jgi:signal peptidase I